MRDSSRDIHIDFETAGLNQLATEASEAIERLAVALPHSKWGAKQLSEFIVKEHQLCCQYFEDVTR